MELFKKGFPVIWPILVSSLVLHRLIGRVIFSSAENSAREHEVVQKASEKVEATLHRRASR